LYIACTVDKKGEKEMQVSPVSINQVNDCPQLPGTILRINIPAGTVINLLNLIEIASPGGICLILRLPLLGGNNSGTLDTIVNAIKQAGGSIEISQV